MKYGVRLVSSAELDIQEIRNFVQDREGEARAGHVLDGLEKAILSLNRNPHRGHVPPELVGFGFFDVLEIHFKPYRIVYEVLAKEVVILVAADGRRNFRDLLEKRILR